MSDIFLSYARPDRARANVISRGLEARGWSVWWDRTIPAGRTFDDVIEEALDSAKCVIVLWSHESVQSRWVRTEAGEAAARNILVPVLIEDTRIPLAFRRIQAADLVGWDGDPKAESFQSLVSDIAAVIGSAPPEEEQQQAELEASRRAEEEEKHLQAHREARCRAEQDERRRQAERETKRGAAEEEKPWVPAPESRHLPASPKPWPLAAVLIAVLVTWLAWFTWPDGELGVMVPEVVSQPIAEARLILENAGLPEVREVQQESDSHPPGTVLKQRPSPGEHLPPLEPVELIVAVRPLSTGSRLEESRESVRVVVPDVVNRPISKARSILRQAGLLDVREVQQESASHPGGTVMRQMPASGERVDKKETVQLVFTVRPTSVSPSQSVRVVVPDVVGTSIAAARSILERTGLSVLEVPTESDSHPPGTVLSQEPPPGERVHEKYPVQLARAERPPPSRTLLGASDSRRIVVPEVVGEPLENALVILVRAGLLDVREVPGESDSHLPGTVLSQQPAPRERVQEKEPVELVVAVAFERKPREPIRVGATVQASKIIYKVEPVYPEVAKRSRTQGMVLLQLIVDEGGNVTEVETIRGNPVLNEAAVQAVQQWRYSPTMVNGEPVPVIFTAALNFTLPPPSLLK